MEIYVKLFASFRNGRFVTEKCTYPDGTCIADVVGHLEIRAGEVGTIMCNNRHAVLSQILAHGDNLAIFPLVGGG